MGTVAESAVLTIGEPSASPTVTTEGILEIEENCLETEVSVIAAAKNESEDSVVNKNGSCEKRNRVRYTKDFIMKCFGHPACSRRPIFELPNLSCILNVARFGSAPFTTLYVPPRRKDENGRKEPEDNISLRPHSGNFSSGCAPNLSPSHYPQGQFNRFQFHHDDPSKNMYDRGYQRNNYRFNNNGRPDVNDRNRLDRDDARDRRDRDPDKRDVRRDARHQNQSRRQNSVLWGPESENPTEWTRRGGRNSDNRDGRGRSSYNNRDKYGGHYREHEEDSEPSWYSEGPTSQHDTIELHGFDDDRDRDRDQGLLPKEIPENSGQARAEHYAAETAKISSGVAKDSAAVSETKSTELEILNQLLTVDHLSGLLPNGYVFEQSEEQPAGSSRFSKLFTRNKTSSASEPPVVPDASEKPPPNRGIGGVSLQDFFAPRPESNSSSSEKKAEVIKGMETELRQILLGGKEIFEQPKEPEPKPDQDLNAFKKLLEDLVIKSNKTVPQKVENSLPDSGSGRPVAGPPPGLQGIPFNPFALISGQAPSRPLQQPHNNMVPSLPVNQMAPSHPLSRLVEQQHETAIQNHKRSGTPILAALTPTAVMRKMTADQQPKPGVSVGGTISSSYGGMPVPANSQAAYTSSSLNSSGNNMNVPRQHNPLSSFVSAMAQNQTQHIAQPQPMPPQVNQPGHPAPPHPGHVPLNHYAGYPQVHPQQRGPFPVRPNSGMPAQFSPYGVPFFNAPMHPRK